jgi:pyruvate/2-oxoacid:ferredoxin oxidoreductase alpha subunit
MPLDHFADTAGTTITTSAIKDRRLNEKGKKVEKRRTDIKTLEMSIRIAHINNNNYHSRVERHNSESILIDVNDETKSRYYRKSQSIDRY